MAWAVGAGPSTSGRAPGTGAGGPRFTLPRYALGAGRAAGTYGAGERERASAGVRGAGALLIFELARGGLGPGARERGC
jgi:hypothetical protein